MQVASAVLVKRARSGDGDAFHILCDRYTKAVWRLAWWVTRDTRDAEEITQETFFHVWSRLADFDESDFPKWLMTIARNAAIDRVRRREVEQRVLGLVAAGQETTVEPDGERRVWSEQIKNKIVRGMERLTVAERIAVFLRFFERLPYAQVGEALGISEIAAQMAVQRAVSKLRISLKDLVRYLYARD